MTYTRAIVWTTAAFLATLAAAAGCGSDDAPTPTASCGGSLQNGGSGGSQKGGAGGAPTGGAGGSNAGGTAGSNLGGESGSAGIAGSSDAGGGAGTADSGAPHPGKGEKCNLFTQNCADPAYPKCRVSSSDGTILWGVCDKLLGTDKEGEECTRPTNKTGVDTCDAGLYCAYINEPLSSNQSRKCRKICDASSACGSNEGCLLLNAKPDEGFAPDTLLAGYCGPLCDMFDATTCPSSTSCLRGAVTENTKLPFCFPSYPGKVGEACKDNQGCSSGLGCLLSTGTDKGTCQPWCNDAHPNCAATQKCTYSGSTEVGICYTPVP